MKLYKEFITELFEKPVRLSYKEKTKRGLGWYWEADFEVDEKSFMISSEPTRKTPKGSGITYEIGYSWTTPMGMYGFGKTNYGVKTAGIVLATVIQFIREFIDEVEPEEIAFTADKEDPGEKDSRTKLYTSMLKKFLPSNYTVKMSKGKWYTGVEYTKFTLTRK